MNESRSNRRGAEDAEKCAENTERQSSSRRFPRRLGVSAVAFSGYLSLLTLAIIAGCINGPMHPAATQPVTITDTATTQPEYWYQYPSPGTVVYDSFPTLYKTCENVCRDFSFKIDRIDYRTGTLTTEPLISAQVWEPWRPDIQSLGHIPGSILASIRRTIRWEFVRREDGTFEVSPKVLVERQTVRERRITSVALYRGAYTPERAQDAPSGSAEEDEGFLIQPRYWYSIGRDDKLEKSLALEVSKRLARKGREMEAPATQESPTTQE